MNSIHDPPSAAYDYSVAYGMHYTEHNVRKAALAYQGIIAAHPLAPEADYSRSQLKNIARSAVPADTLLAAEMEVAFAHLLPGDDTAGETSS